MKKLYLAGPILDCNSAEARDWREDVKKQLGDVYEIGDPHDWTPEDKSKPDFHHELVNRDLDYIRSCDVVLAYTWKASPGTSMELVYAKQFGVMSIVVDKTESPWIKAHADIMCVNMAVAISLLRAESTKIR